MMVSMLCSAISLVLLKETKLEDVLSVFVHRISADLVRGLNCIWMSFRI